MKNVIPVVMATDENYVYPTIVALTSLFCNAKETTEYKVYILVSGEFREEKKELIQKSVQKYHMPNIEFVNMEHAYSDMHMHVAHITYASFYRLQIHTLFPELEKCIYLDVDVLVHGDLSEYYQIDITDYYIAGVKAAGYYYPESKQEQMKKTLEIPVFDQYVNAGVLLMNLKKLREDGFEKRFAELLTRDFPSHDQDILNCACYGKIKILPPIFNAMTKYDLGNVDAYQREKCLSICYTEMEWEAACKNPIIVHYADKRKPWDDMTVFRADEWWMYARKSNLDGDCFQYFLPVIREQRILEKRDHEKRLKEMADERQKIAYELANVNREKEIFEKKLSELEKENIALLNKYHLLEEEKNKSDEAMVFLQKEKQTLETQVKKEKKKLKKNQQELNRVEKELDSLKSRFWVRVLRKLDRIKKCIFNGHSRS